MMGVEETEMEQNEKNIHTDGLLTVQQFAALVGKSPQSIYKRLNKVDNPVDNQVVNPIQPYVVVVDGQKMLKIQAISELYGVEVEQPIQPGCQPENEKLSTPFNPVEGRMRMCSLQSSVLIASSVYSPSIIRIHYT